MQTVSQSHGDLPKCTQTFPSSNVTADCRVTVTDMYNLTSSNKHSAKRHTYTHTHIFNRNTSPNQVFHSKCVFCGCINWHSTIDYPSHAVSFDVKIQVQIKLQSIHRIKCAPFTPQWIVEHHPFAWHLTVISQVILKYIYLLLWLLFLHARHSLCDSIKGSIAKSNECAVWHCSNNVIFTVSLIFGAVPHGELVYIHDACIQNGL